MQVMMMMMMICTCVCVGCHSDLSNNQLVSLPELAFANLTDLNTLLVPTPYNISHFINFTFVSDSVLSTRILWA